MKKLKAVLLTILIAVCVVIAAAVVIDSIGGGGDDDAQIGSRFRRNATEEAEGTAVALIEAEDAVPEEDYRLWQRATTQSDETGLWQYYPVLPWDVVMPGETAVLGVSAIGFMGWDVDPNFAHVELFDEKIDDGTAYISFIMPEDEASIVALYDEVPLINYEIQREQYMSRSDYHEYGAVPISPASGSLIPEVGQQVDLIAIQDEFIFFTFVHPADLEEGRRYQGSIEWVRKAEGMEWDP